MPSSVSPWREHGTSAVLQGKLRTVLYVTRGQPEWYTLGWVCSAMSSPWEAHKHQMSWYETAIAFLAVRIIGQKTEQCAWSGSLVLLFRMCLGWDILPSQRMGILFSVLFFTYCLCCIYFLNVICGVSSTNTFWNDIWNGHDPSLQKLAILCWSISYSLSISKVHIHINISYCKMCFVLLEELLLCVMVMMLIAMSCILVFNHYDSLTGMVPKPWIMYST